MATSRYDTGTGATAAALRAAGTNTNSSGNTTGTSTTAGSSSSQGTSTTNSNSTSNTSTQNMTGTSLAALENLIATLQGGGTLTQQLQQAQRTQEIQRLQSNRDGYSRENAFADAQGLMAQTMRTTLERLVPSINKAAAGAGASQSSMRALLLQQAAENAAENASAQGLSAAVNYGNVANGAGGTIASLINGQQDTATQALLAALNVARGAVTNSTTNTSGTSTTDTEQSGNTNSTTNTSQNTNQNTNTSIGNGNNSTGSTTGNNQTPNELVYFGPQQTTQQVASAGTGSSLDTLLQLAGNTNGGWSNSFTF